MNEEDAISLFYAKSHSETYKIFFPLAQKGNKFANYFLGNMLISPIDQTIETNINDGLSFLKLSARAGYSPALELLGNIYAYNEKVKNNLVDAHTYFYLAAIIENKIDLGLPIDSSVNYEFEKNLKHKNYIFSNSIDFVQEFFNFERKLNNNVLSKSLKILGKNSYINKLFTKVADKGINF